MSNRKARPQGPPPRRQRSRPSLRSQLLFVFGILVLTAGAFYTALVVATQIDQIFFPDSELKPGGIFSSLPGVDKGSDAGDIGGSRKNILVMGLDRRPREGNAPTRTDTMFVMTIDPSTKTTRGLAMPRDLYVDIPTKSGGSFKERINTAYVYGETSNYPGGGPALAKETVSRLLDIKIDNYVIIDFEGFKKLIDAIGGIDVDVGTAVNDPFYSETELLGDYYPCIFNVGTHHMNGSDALCYARTRRNSNDFDRIQRQQRIIFAALDKANSLKLLGEPTNMVNLWKNYKNTVQTDISDLQIPGFAKLASGVDPNSLAFLSLAAVTTPFTTSEGAAVLIPSQAGIDELVRAFMADQHLVQEHATIEVQNGTDKQGLAQKAVDQLTTSGIPEASLKVANAATTALARTEIVDFTNKNYTAKWIANQLNLPNDRIRHATAADVALNASQVDIVVILGSDAKIESSAAAAP